MGTRGTGVISLAKAIILPALTLLIAAGLFWPSPAATAHAPPGLLTGADAVAVGTRQMCALVTSTDVRCWGANFRGEAGDGTTWVRLGPSQVIDLPAPVTQIAAGGDQFNGTTCAVLSTGGVACWGSNQGGQMGIRTNDSIPHPVPEMVEGLSSGVSFMATGFIHSCAVASAGALKCWGANNSGQLGDGTTTSRFSSADVCADSACSGYLLGVTSVDAGGAPWAGGHTCAVTSSGGAKCWGYNGIGQLGDGTTVNRLTPVDVTGLTSGVVAVATGGLHTCALTSAGGVKCWGHNTADQLGNGTFGGASSVPVDVSGLSSGAIAIAAGYAHTCVLLSDQTAKCWGANDVLQLGQGNPFEHSSVPIDVCETLTQDHDCATVLAGATALDAEDYRACAVVAEGRVKCWGLGLLGDGHRFWYQAVDVIAEDPDVDGDGCSYAREDLAFYADEGGLRDPKNFWDFFDTPDTSNLRDKSVAGTDFFRLLARFGSSGDSMIDPLSAPLVAPAYHTAFDRGASSGPNAWDLTAANGSIAGTDFFAMLVQFGHSCA